MTAAPGSKKGGEPAGDDHRRVTGRGENDSGDTRMKTGGEQNNLPRWQRLPMGPDNNTYSLLVLEYIDATPRRGDFWESFGAGLARMHRREPGDNQFGLDHDNYIGSLPQRNGGHGQWIDFFVEERLEAQLKMARDKGKAGRELNTMFASLYRHLPDFFPVEPPSLVHGDLWSGNYMTGSRGEAVIIDPAAYYGHRYMDLGMSKLFGGFSPAFYRAYREEWPVESNWEEALDVANLYPLMVHVNLFGGGYLQNVKSILRRYS